LFVVSLIDVARAGLGTKISRLFHQLVSDGIGVYDAATQSGKQFITGESL
jgi:hypothetical protein